MQRTAAQKKKTMPKMQTAKKATKKVTTQKKAKIATKKVTNKTTAPLAPISSPSLFKTQKRFGGGGGAYIFNDQLADQEYREKYGLYFAQQNGDFTQYNSSHYDHNLEHYALKPHEADHKTRNYLMMGASNAAYLGLGRSIVHVVVGQLQASADVLALASVEVDISGFEEGTTATIKWRGKPVFVKNRTAEEIAISKKDDEAPMRDQQTDAERVQRDNWLVVLGVCTHLGCVPIPNAGNHAGGFFCPCHGSHYDASGRIREGPAPLNLEVPAYKFLDDNTLVIG